MCLGVHGWMVIASTRGENVPRVLLGIVCAIVFYLDAYGRHK